MIKTETEKCTEIRRIADQTHVWKHICEKYTNSIETLFLLAPNGTYWSKS